MALIADILLISGALGAAFYCLVLSRKLNQLKSLETGVGGAIASLSRQMNELTQALETAKAEAQTSTALLDDSARRAESAAQELRALLDRAPAASAPTIEPKAPGRPPETQPTFRRRRSVEQE